MARLWRAYHPGLPAQAGAEVELTGEEAHHVGRVLRLGPGDRLSLFDGAGREWEAVIQAAPSRRVLARLDRERTEPVESPLELRLYQGLCRAERMDWLVQKGTEIGLAAIHPIPTARSERARADGKRLERWRRIAIEAAKQCGRRRLPEITPRDDLPERGSGDGAALLLDPGPGSRALGSLLDESAPGPVRLAVGPEGGFATDEIERWSASGWRRAEIGPRTLRAETAGLVAAAVILHAWGDLGASRR